MRAHWHKIAVSAAILVVVIAAGVWAWRWFFPVDRRPALAAVTPLAPVTRSSKIIAPIAIALTAIRDSLEKQAPHDLSGKPDLSSMPFMDKLDMSWSVSRGPLTLEPRGESLAISTPLSGSMRASGAPGGPAAGFNELLGNLLGRGQAPRQGDTQPEKREQRADIRGGVTLIARPALLPQWRLEPNLTSQISVAEANFDIMGMKLSVPEQVKPLLERTINAQVESLQAHLRNDPFLELAAREKWAQMCRSIPLGAAAPGMPDLWLELRPTRAFAAQPGLDRTSVLLTLGVEADTRIVPSQTKPDCPFPAQLEIVPRMEQGQVSIGVPIDIPFTEINRLIGEQLIGKIIPEDRSGGYTATIRSVSLAASGDRLLISVGVRADETRTWFGLGADATVHVWGRPKLDPARRQMRLTDLALDVESAAAYGVLGAAARAAMPYLERLLADRAVIDLAPLTENARRSIATAVADFRKRTDNVQVEAELIDLRLVDLAFDATTVRVIAEAEGTVRATVLKLDAP
jgi:hypothetical protein